MELISVYMLQCHEKRDEDEFIKKLARCLDNGAAAGDIDLIVPQTDLHGWTYFGTILHYGVVCGYERIVKYALSRGADIAIKRTSEDGQMVIVQNALELAARSYNRNHQRDGKAIYEILKKRSLELYSSYGLTSFHLECALDMKHWSDRAKRSLRTAEVNAAVSAKSPFWPAMTPILIATKLLNLDLVECLLDRGADPVVWDLEGNTPLHYFSSYHKFYDDGLFASDGRNTFGSLTREAHFHIACKYCPRALHIVKRYLDQGISPDLPMLSRDYMPSKFGLHIAAERGCTELVQLLLEYGADVNKEDSSGRTPAEYVVYSIRRNFFKPLCLLIETGSNQERIDIQLFFQVLSQFCRVEAKQDFFKCVTRLVKLKKELVCKKFMDVYREISKKIADGAEYADRCSKEVQTLSDLGLLNVLDDTAVVKPDFEKSLGGLQLAFELCPEYGLPLRIKTSRKLVELEDKKRKIPKVIPRIQHLFRSFCLIPHLCAEKILWNLTVKELAQLMMK